MTRSNRGFSLKDQLINQNKVRYLAGLFARADKKFDPALFEIEVMEQLHALELKARISMIAGVLSRHLSPDFNLAAAQILAALPAPLDPDKQDDDFGDFILAPLGVFISTNGQNHVDLSLALLHEVTKRFSMEFDIRFFINHHENRAMDALRIWATDENYHVRRLVSEGTRPRLPWGQKIGIEPEQPVALLDILHSDKTRFVTRSVANHLNDISKINPDLVLEILLSWKKQARQSPAELDWITRHALRSLIKQGNLGALEMLGYRQAPEISVTGVEFSDNLRIGDTAMLDFKITAKRDEKLMVDYVIDFVKKNGSSRPRVFKLKKLDIKAGETVNLSKSHRFLKDATTFTHYPGPHRMWLQINGQKFGLCEFELS